jgi:RNA polymerase-binding transcription factor DksA
MPLDAAARARCRRQVLDKGRQLAGALERLMAGLDVRLETLGMGSNAQAEQDRRARLRRQLDHVDRVVKSFDAGTFGHCLDCRAEIDELRLVETPWSGRCGACFQRALREGTL